MFSRISGSVELLKDHRDDSRTLYVLNNTATECLTSSLVETSGRSPGEDSSPILSEQVITPTPAPFVHLTILCSSLQTAHAANDPCVQYCRSLAHVYMHVLHGRVRTMPRFTEFVPGHHTVLGRVSAEIAHTGQRTTVRRAKRVKPSSYTGPT